jgi:type IV pilus assembly protein PilW
VSATNDANDTQVVTYLSGSDLDSAFSADGLNDRWKRVVSVKICLLMRSPEKLADLPATASYRDCSGTVVASTDGYLHRAFITTATLRNRLTITDRNRKNES